MEITKQNIKDAGSCNFCNKGVLKTDGFGLNYPYSKVYVIKGKCVAINICFECAKILKKEI